MVNKAGCRENLQLVLMQGLRYHKNDVNPEIETCYSPSEPSSSISRIIKKTYGDKSWQFERYYLPTPPLGQDMTQGQFLSGV